MPTAPGGTLPPAYTGDMHTFALVTKTSEFLFGYGVTFTDGRCLVTSHNGRIVHRYADEHAMNQHEDVGRYMRVMREPPGPGFPWPRRFVFQRHHDATGFSGPGAAMEGVVFPHDGGTFLMWLGEYPSLVEWPSVEMATTVHGHGGATELRWLDPGPEQPSP